MIRLISIFLLFFIIAICGNAQKPFDDQYYVVDTLKYLEEDKGVYDFYFKAGTQGLYLGEFQNYNFKRFKIRIFNNYDVPVFIDRYKARDCKVHLPTSNRYDTIQPRSYFEVKSLWMYHTIGRINCPLYVNFYLNGSKKNVAIRIWGESKTSKEFLDSLNNIKKEKKPLFLPQPKDSSLPNIHVSKPRTLKTPISKKTHIKKPTFYKRYNEQGLLVREEYAKNKTQNIRYDFKKDSIVARYVLRNTTYYKNDTFMIEKGTFKGDTLWNGIRTMPNSTSLPSNKHTVKNGKQVGYIFNGEEVNKRDSIGLQGKWISVDRNTKIIRDIRYFKNNTLIDSSTYYYSTGELMGINYNGFKGDTSFVEYYKSGKIKLIKERQFTHHFSEENQECAVRKTFPYPYEFLTLSNYVKSKKLSNEAVVSLCKSLNISVKELNNGYNEEELNPIHYDYIHRIESFAEDMVIKFENCEIISRTYPRYVYFQSIECSERVPYWYIKETGSFIDEELYNGTIWIYNDKHRLTKSIKVIKGIATAK